jgi:hypothetical protein
MLKDQIVCIRLKRHFHEEAVWVYVGKCIQWSENWVAVDGKGIMILRGRQRTTEIDDKVRRVVLPREVIMSVQQLPDNFDLKTISVGITGSKLTMPVEGGKDCIIAEAAD